MKKPYWIAALCAILSISLLFWGFGFNESEAQPGKPKPRCALVLTEDKGTAVMQFKQGAQIAADELGVALEAYTTEQSTSADAQILDWLAAWETAPPAALILPPCAQETLERAAAMAAANQMKLVLVGKWSELASACILFDREEQGRQLARAMIKHGGALTATAYTDGTPEADARLAGMRAELGPEAELRLAEVGGDGIADLAELPPDANLIALSPEVTRELIALRMRANAPGMPLWGIDPGEGRVESLERYPGGLLIEMPYAQGYLAVAAAVDSAGGHPPKGAVYAPSRVVTRETMYRSENVKLVFPLLQ